MMNKIVAKLKDRLNLTVLVQAILAIVTPVGVYYGITVGDLTTWGKLGEVIVDALSNPAVVISIVISLWQTFNNPTESKFAIKEKEVELEEDLFNEEVEEL